MTMMFRSALFALVLAIQTLSAGPLLARSDLDPESVWQAAQPHLLGWSDPERLRKNARFLYNLQHHTVNVLIHADRTDSVLWMERLAVLYGRTFDALHTMDRAVFRYPGVGANLTAKDQIFALDRPSRMWLMPPRSGLEIGPEQVLTSSQFLYAVSRLTRMISELENPGPVLRDFAAKAAPIAAREHYMRWILRREGMPGPFQRRGWGCSNGSYGHHEHIIHIGRRLYGTAALGSRRSSLSYCNIFNDLDMWIVAGAGEVASAALAMPDRLGLTAYEIETLARHARLGAEVMMGRHATRIDETTGLTVAVFDPGGFRDHPGHSYAGYSGNGPSCTSCVPKCEMTCTVFPGWRVKGDEAAVPAPPRVEGIAWDIGHARRLVPIYDSMERLRAITGASFPTKEHIAQLARQLAFVVWNGDSEAPVFSNYFDGTDGWYRVNYSNRPAFGYAPGSRTKEALSLSYGFWREYEPRVGLAVEAVARKYGNTLSLDSPGEAARALLMVFETEPVVSMGRQ